MARESHKTSLLLSRPEVASAAGIPRGRIVVRHSFVSKRLADRAVTCLLDTGSVVRFMGHQFMESEAMGLWRFLKKISGGIFHTETRISDTVPDSVIGRGKKNQWSRRFLIPFLHEKLSQSFISPSVANQMTPPHRLSRYAIHHRCFNDLTTDTDYAKLEHFVLPQFRTPEEVADYFKLPLGKLAWLVHRFEDGQRAPNTQKAHYHFHWLPKRRGGFRLIEAPKQTLRSVQQTILKNILDRIPPHPAAHGFVKRKSILTNATPHVGREVILKFDLSNFYASVRFARVVAIFRAVGYCREAANWLARLCVSAVPANMPFPKNDPDALKPYLHKHLPQGAPTSPALANLSAFSLDVRLSGLAKCYSVNYTRYADDLTFSGGIGFSRALADFIYITTKIIRAERFQPHPQKRAVLRQGQRQIVTGVVVNQKPNISRTEFDRLKAILHNCARFGPEVQNRNNHDNFQQHLLGKISFVRQLNPHRGEKLARVYEKIRW